MTKQEKLYAVSQAYTTMEKNGETIHIINEDKVNKEVFDALFHKIQNNLGVDFNISYDIMADACDIIANKTLEGTDRDSLVGDDLDFYADADSQANVYTSVQLSYLSINNESEISELMKDEAITSVAQACSAWYTQKVVEACEALKAYILE